MRRAEQLKSEWRQRSIFQTGAMRLVVLASLLVVLEPAAFGQSSKSKEPFFTVSTSRTFSPSQQPKVSISFRQVDHLDFRVYRVKDPIKFFFKLRDAH